MHAYRTEIKNDSLCCTEVQVLCSPQEDPLSKYFWLRKAPFLLVKSRKQPSLLI